MQWRNTSTGYGAVAKFLHWSIVILVVAQYVLAELAEDLPRGAEKLELMARHKSVGILVLLLALVRIGWKLGSRGLPPPVPMPRLQRIAAAASHGLLYALILVQPLSGWATASSGGRPVSFFGWFDLPALVAASEQAHEAFEESHEFFAGALFVVVLLHALAALYHHFWRKDDTLRRMLPFARPRSP